MQANTEGIEGPRGSRWRIAAWAAAGLLLLVPLVAMQFTNEVNWTAFDFAFAGALILAVGATFEIAVRKTGSTAFRIAVGIALAAGFLLIWINGAVGIIGSEKNPANLMYLGVLAVGFIGAIIARFRPNGLAIAMFAAAAGQVLVAVIALAADLGASGPGWPGDVLGLTVFFAVLWTGSGLMFRNAARERTPSVND